MDAEDLQKKYLRAREVMTQGRDAIAESHRLMRELLPHVTHARTRGKLRQQLWDAERMTGHRAHHFSQAGQDAWLDENVFRGKREGTFVEIGGYDGITGSNCLFFEMQRGWSGVLIEPSPTFFARASAFRRATCLQVALADAEGEAEFLEVREGFSQMSGLTATYDPSLRQQVESDPRHKGDLIRVKTQTLPQILDAQGLMQVDYVSLDVEGGELAVLSAFPFEKYEIHAWTVENNTASPDVPNLMQSKGYNRVEALGVDDVYVKTGSA